MEDNKNGNIVLISYGCRLTLLYMFLESTKVQLTDLYISYIIRVELAYELLL